MKKILFLLTVAILAVLTPTVTVLAQVDSTVDSTGGGTGGGPLDFLGVGVTTAVALVLAIYEVVISYYPTVKNYSIVSWIYKALRYLIPNKKAGGGTHG